MKLLQLAAVAASLFNFALGGLTNNELLELSKKDKNGIIYLNDGNYQALLDGPRDYHLVSILTSTSSQINCVLCSEFRPEYELVSRSWLKDHPNGLSEDQLEAKDDKEDHESSNSKKASPKNIYFLYSEFTESRTFFGLLQLNNIPKVFYFPPTTDTTPNGFLQDNQEYQFYAGDHKELLVGWLNQLTGQKLPIHIPPDYTKVAVNIVGSIAIIALGRTFSKQLLQILASKLIWSGLSLVFILLLTSGYMFNQIRGVPYLRELGDGKLEYFMAGQQQNQFGVETQIISFVYGCLSFFMVVLVKKAPELKNTQVRFITVIVFTALVFVMYGILVSIFSLKSTGYPYKLLRVR